MTCLAHKRGKQAKTHISIKLKSVHPSRGGDNDGRVFALDLNSEGFPWAGVVSAHDDGEVAEEGLTVEPLVGHGHRARGTAQVTAAIVCSSSTPLEPLFECHALNLNPCHHNEKKINQMTVKKLRKTSLDLPCSLYLYISNPVRAHHIGGIHFEG